MDSLVDLAREISYRFSTASNSLNSDYTTPATVSDWLNTAATNLTLQTVHTEGPSSLKEKKDGADGQPSCVAQVDINAEIAAAVTNTDPQPKPQLGTEEFMSRVLQNKVREMFRENSRKFTTGIDRLLSEGPLSQTSQKGEIFLLFELLSVKIDQHEINVHALYKTRSSLIQKQNDASITNSLEIDKILQSVNEQMVYIRERFELIQHVIFHIKPYQIKLSPKNFSFLCRQYAKYAQVLDEVCSALYPLQVAVTKIHEVEPFTLTGVHLDLLQLSQSSSTIDLFLSSPASKDFTVFQTVRVNPSNFPIDAQEYLTYYYQLGCSFVELKMWTYAIEAFIMTLVIQTNSVSPMQVSAYKKLVLICLIHHGELPSHFYYASAAASTLSTTPAVSLPRYISPMLLRHAEGYASVYSNMARFVQSDNINSLTEYLKAHHDVIQKDENSALTSILLAHVKKRRIKNLTQTYVTLTTEDLAKRAQLPNESAEQTVREMVADGEIFARFDVARGNVTFLDDTEEYDDSETTQLLNEKIQSVISLSSMLKDIDQRIVCDPLYLVRSGALGEVSKLVHETGGSARGALHQRYAGGSHLQTNDMSDPEMAEAIRRSKLDQRR